MRRVAKIAAVLSAIAVAFIVATGASEPEPQDLPRARDLRRCVVRRAGGGRPDRRSQRRQHPVARGDVRKARGGHDLDHKRRFHAVSRRCPLRDSSAVADRRRVRRLSAGQLEHAGATADQERPRDRQLLPAGHAHELADRLRHRPEHIPGTGPPVARRDHQRVRHRPRGARLRSERGDPPRQPGARRHRQGDPDPRASEPPTRPARDRLRRRARPARTRAPPDLDLRHRGEPDLGRERPARRGHLQDVQAVPVLPAPAAAAAGRSGRARRSGDAADENARPERLGTRPAVRQPDPVCGRRAQGPDRPRERIAGVAAGAARVDAARAAAQQARHRRQADRQVTRSADRQPREHRRDPAADGSAVQRRGGRERLRQPRPLRARRAARLELHELRHPAGIGLLGELQRRDRCRRAGIGPQSGGRASGRDGRARAGVAEARRTSRRYRGDRRSAGCARPHEGVRQGRQVEGGIISQAVRHAGRSQSGNLEGLLGYLVGGRK